MKILFGIILLIALVVWISCKLSPANEQCRRQPFGVERRAVPDQKPSPPKSQFRLVGLRMPWDVRPEWLWNDYWTVDELPYGVRWADNLKAKLEQA